MKPSRPSVRSGVRSAGQRGDDLARQPRGVDEHVLGPAGMRVDAGDRQHHLLGGERLVLQLAEVGAVERVGAARRRSASTSNSVAPSPISSSGVKQIAQRRARQLRVRGQVGDRGHDLRHARLVVGAEQRVAAGGHDVVADLVGELGHLAGIEHRPAARQRDRRAVVGAVHDRLDARAGRVRTRVDVRDQPDDRPVAGAASRSRSRCRPARRRRARSPAVPPRAAARGRAGPGCWGSACGRARTGCRCGRSAGSAPAGRGPGSRPEVT